MAKRGASSKNSLVTFHDAHDPQYGVLSPLSPHPLVVRHQQYPSLHHYFLCERFAGSPAVAKLQNAASVWELERLVTEAEEQRWQRADWNRVKIDAMLLGAYCKFKQNDGPRRVLLETEQAVLVDHTPLDDFWGDGGDGSGKNIMGVVLMAVRERLLRESTQEQQRKKVEGPPVKGGGAGAGGGVAGMGARAVRAVGSGRR